MTIKSRIQGAINALTSKQGYNSVTSSTIQRNYGKPATFNPHQQVTGITYKAIDKTGRSISDYEIVIKNKAGDVVTNHPLYNLYNKPNPRQTASDFIHLWSMLMEIYGETFWYKVRGVNTNKIKELYLLNPAQIEVKVDGGEVVGYVLHKSDGNQVPFMPEEILHDKYPNPFNELRGMSVLEKAAVYVDTEIATSTFTLNYIRNNASPSGIVSLPSMDKETFKQFAAQWREGYEGPQNAGKTAFIRGGEANFQAVGATLKDVDQEITRKMAKDDVLMMLEMPKSMLGMGEEKGMGRANIDTIYYMFNSEKIDPMMKRLDRIYQSLLQELVPNDTNSVTHVSPIPEDKEYKLQTYEKGINKWLTANEIREAEGLEPIKGGEFLVQNTQTQPAEPQKAHKKIVLKKPTQVSKAEQLKLTKSKQEQMRQQLQDTSETYAGEIKKEIAKFADKQEKTVVANIGSKKKAADWLFNVKEESETLTAALMPIIVDLIEEQTKDIAAFISGELVPITDTFKKAIQQDILKLAGIYNEDTLKAVQSTLAEGQAANESLVSLKKRVEGVYQDAKGYRAERIARTESLRASNATAEQTYLENGFSQVEWFINPGACEFCQTYAGRVKTIGANFTNIGDVITAESGAKMRIEYDDIKTPPLHPNCTCSLVPAR